MRFFATLSFTLAALMASAPAPVVATPQRVFISGHSLVDQPLPDHLARIAESLGQPLQWNRQYVVGSTIHDRTRGRDRESGWAGYATGLNREGQGLDVIQEFRRPRTTDGQPYDTLIVTEQHGVLESIVMRDTVRLLRHYHERFIEGNAHGQTWFYEPWLGVIDKRDPSRWLAYERAAAPIWQCVLTRINTSLAAEGRADRLRPLPASLALATLVERAVQGKVPGLAAQSAEGVMNLLFRDHVHLTPLGAYYMALSVYAATFGRSPAGAWAPPQVSPPLAAALQQLAWEAVSTEQNRRTPLPLEKCGAALKALAPVYFEHKRDDYWAQQEASLLNTYRRLRQEAEWRWRLWRHFDGDPFRYSASTDNGNWLPAP